MVTEEYGLMNIQAKKKIIAISYLFPNCNQPNHGIFVLNRLKAMSKYADITVINPIAAACFAEGDGSAMVGKHSFCSSHTI